jgi:hypothetical protein
MRNAYALLGLSFLIVFIGAYFVIERANAPTPEEVPFERTDADSTTYEEADEISIMLTLTSPAFEENGMIPSRYTCDGENINPELRIGIAPEGTMSLVLVMDDPDIPESVKEERGIEKFDHWVLYNIPKDTSVIQENSSVGTEGLTSRGTTGFVGSCPPDREHRYIYRLYALGETLAFPGTPTLDEVEEIAKEKALGSATLIGRYERIQQ